MNHGHRDNFKEIPKGRLPSVFDARMGSRIAVSEVEAERAIGPISPLTSTIDMGEKLGEPSRQVPSRLTKTIPVIGTIVAAPFLIARADQNGKPVIETYRSALRNRHPGDILRRKQEGIGKALEQISAKFEAQNRIRNNKSKPSHRPRSDRYLRYCRDNCRESHHTNV